MSAGDIAAPPVSFEVEQDGRYLVAFSSWDDTGTGDYRLDIECEGTDFQCRRPDFVKPCTAGQIFIQGTTIAQDTASDAAAHPFVGTWIVDTISAGENDSPEIAVVTAGGGVVGQGANRSAGGRWRWGRTSSPTP